MSSSFKNRSLTIAHADDGKFEGAGLWPFFECRALGVKSASKGAYGAHVIRAGSCVLQFATLDEGAL